jgi:hypothetical protein
MEEWIKEQIKFNRTICLYDENWNPFFKIKTLEYKESLLNFIISEYDKDKHHLLSDNNLLYDKKIYPNYYTHFPNYNNPINIYNIYIYLNEFKILLQKPHWKHLGKHSMIFPNEIMDIIWKNYYINIIITKINNFYIIVNNILILKYKNYYIYCLLCWIETNFDLIFSKLNYKEKNNSVLQLLKYINYNIIEIQNKNFSFEYKCPQIKNLFFKWNSILSLYFI